MIPKNAAHIDFPHFLFSVKSDQEKKEDLDRKDRKNGMCMKTEIQGGKGGKEGPHNEEQDRGTKEYQDRFHIDKECDLPVGDTME